MADNEEAKKLPPRVPTPLKRRKQDAKKTLQNRVVKSKIHTARIKFQSEKDPEAKKGLLDILFSQIDKAKKRGLYKDNKADRLKSRLRAKI